MLAPAVVMVMLSVAASAQTTVKGTVIEKSSDEPVIGASIVIKGSTEGTTTDLDGNFELKTGQKPPFTLEITSVGLSNQDVQVTQNNQTIKVKMEEYVAGFGDGVVVSASRVEEKIMESPVTVEKLDPIAIRQSSTADYYDELSKLKGVHTNTGSLTFTSINTRGFASIANTRFVQLMDGMDNAAPLLNFPTGNIVGISELDIANVELVPGAASALYGPNAFNGILLMNSKDPYTTQGLSAQVKIGLTSAQGDNNDVVQNMRRGAFPYQRNFNPTEPSYQAAIRYSKAFGKFAIKANVSVLDAQDWPANDYTTDRAFFNSNVNAQEDARKRMNLSYFDGMNTYGDELVVPMNSGSVINNLLNSTSGPALVSIFGNGSTGLNRDTAFANIQALMTRTSEAKFTMSGIREEDLLETRRARSFKGDLSLHYKITDDVEAIYSFRMGGGASVYQGSERYALRDFTQQYHKVEVKGKNFFARVYGSFTDAGKSYNMTALGTYMLNSSGQTIRYQDANGQTQSFVTESYIANYLSVYAGSPANGVLFAANGSPITTGDPLTPAQYARADSAARTFANSRFPQPGTPQFYALRDTIMAKKFQRGGASFTDASRLYHAEFNYDLSQWTKSVVDMQIGANYRLYSLWTNGTIFNEDPDGDGVNERINIGEFGVYLQVSRKLLADRLKLSGSIRYDKNENFDGQITPRVSAVYSAGSKRQHNFRASFQTGFRNPDTQSQFIYFPTSSILLGGTRNNNTKPDGSSRYNVYQTPVLTEKSGFRDTITLDYIKPEQLTAYEVGYKGLFANNKLFLDFNFYYNEYKNFQTQINVRNIIPASHQGMGVNPIDGSNFATFRAYTNDNSTIQSWGSALGFGYKLPKDFTFSGNYSYAGFSQDKDAEARGFEPGFNTPTHRFNLSLENRNSLVKNLGFVISYRWQDKFLWQNSFGNGMVQAFGSLDAQVNYTIKKIKTQVKLGCSNIVGPEYVTNVGGPFVGRMAYISFTFDEAMK